MSTLSVEHVKSSARSSSTHDFVLRAPTGEAVYALETETKHVQRVVKCQGERKDVLLKIEWRGSGRDLVEMHLNGSEEHDKPVPIRSVWEPPVAGETYVETFTGADGEAYAWTKVAGGNGVLEAHLTRANAPTPIARYTSSRLAFGLPAAETKETSAGSTLELAEGSEAAGEMLFVTFLVGLGRAHASNAFTLRGFLRVAVDTWTMNMLG